MLKPVSKEGLREPGYPTLSQLVQRRTDLAGEVVRRCALLVVGGGLLAACPGDGQQDDDNDTTAQSPNPIGTPTPPDVAPTIAMGTPTPPDIAPTIAMGTPTPPDYPTPVGSPTPTEPAAYPTPAGTPGPPTPEVTPEPPHPTGTPAPPETASYRFTIDVSGDADEDPGTNLNEVRYNENVYFYGDFNGWDPQDEAFVMTDNLDGTFYIDLEFPLESEAGGGSVIFVGDAFKYKVAKTSTDLMDPASNEVVDYKPNDQQVCATIPENYLMPGALYLVGGIVTKIKEGSHEVTFAVDAWRAWAEAYGYVVCQ